MAVDIARLFRESLPAALARNAADAQAIGARFQMNVTGPTGGQWTIDATAAGPSCTPGEAPADCTVTVADEDFQKLLEDPQTNGTQLFLAGKLKVTGNPMLAMKLQKVLSYK